MKFDVLDALGAELDRAIARDQRRRVPRPRTLGPLALALLATLLCAGATAAASYLLTGSPIPGAHPRDVPSEATPLTETARLMGLDAPDPSGGLAWDLRVSRSRTGQLCTAVGQVAKGRLGIVGLDGRFRALPQLGYDTCGEDPAGSPALLGARVFDAPRAADVRTVVSGVAGAGVTRVVVRASGAPAAATSAPCGTPPTTSRVAPAPMASRRAATAATTSRRAAPVPTASRPVAPVRCEPRTLALGPGGSFVTVYAGYPEDVAPVVTFSRAGAADRTIALAAIDGARAADPEGGARWTVSAGVRAVGVRAGQTCAQVERERGRDQAPPSFSPPVCGDLREDPFFFAVVPLPRDDKVRAPYVWDPGTPRTMVWGATGPAVERVTVDGKAVTPSPKGFVVALPAGTRPADVAVEVTLAGGETRRLVGSQNLRAADGSRLAPRLLEPVAVAKRPPWLIADGGSVRIARRVADPAGGRDWAVRTFDARLTATDRRVRCVQLGRVDGARFLRPGDLVPLALTDANACTPRNRDPVGRIETFVDDARAYAPSPLRTVVWGTAGPQGRGVEVAGRRLELATDGAFLAFFAPGRDLVVRTTDADGVTHSVERYRAQRPVTDQRIEARAPDPDGGAPYGLLLWRDAKGRDCRFAGRIVAGRVGTLNARTGTFSPYPVHEGGSCDVPATSRSHPVLFGVTSEPRSDGSAIRRTLPGRTIISGTAHPDVREITIQTPRDVRTLRPAGRAHSFLAVYDGEFFSGTITVTARLADGSTRAQTLPIG